MYRQLPNQITIFRLFRSRNPMARSLAPAVVIVTLMIAQRTAHIAITGARRHARGSLDPTWQELALPRAQGALSRTSDAAIIDAVQRYAASHLKPDETWFDFTNRGNLYFLLDRDCPIREYETADYETLAKQREVIRRIEENPRVRAVLLPGPSGLYMVDGVSNAERAPLVWNYVQTHFHADFAEGVVVFWRRN